MFVLDNKYSTRLSMDIIILEQFEISSSPLWIIVCSRYKYFLYIHHALLLVSLMVIYNSYWMKGCVTLMCFNFWVSRVHELWVCNVTINNISDISLMWRKPAYHEKSMTKTSMFKVFVAVCFIISLLWFSTVSVFEFWTSLEFVITKGVVLC